MQFPLPVPPEQVYRVATIPPPPPPPPCQRRFQNRFRAFSPLFLFFWLIRPVIANAVYHAFCFSIWRAVVVNILYLQVHAIDGLGRGCAFVEILYNRSHPRPRRILLLHMYVHSTKYTNCTLTPSPTGNQTPCSRSLIAHANPVSSEHAVPAIIVWSPRGKLYVRCHLLRTTFVGEGGAAQSCPVA